MQNINLSDVRALASLLAPFEDCSRKLEGSNYPTLHLVITHIKNLTNILTLSDNDVEIVKKCKVALKKYLDEIVFGNLKKFHKIALFLFPPKNKLSQFTEVVKKETLKELESIMIETHLKTQAEEIDIINPPNLAIDPIFADYIQPIENLNIHSVLKTEISAYENVNLPYSPEFNVLQWWKNNQQQFPLLYKIACKLLAVPASSAASERAFSVAKNLINNKRCKIATTDDSVNKIMFLHSNIDILYNDTFFEINL